MTDLEKAKVLLQLAERLIRRANDAHPTTETEDAYAYLSDNVIPNLNIAIQQEDERPDENGDDYTKHMKFECRPGRFV